MELFNKMVSLQIQLLLLMMIGLIVKKGLKVSDEQQKGMTNLLINVFLPANIINSFLGNTVSGSVLSNLAFVFLFSLGIQTLSSIAGPIIFKSFPKSKSHVMTYGLIVSNSSFIGIPIAETIYGSLAVMMTSVFQIPIRITMWTAGLSLFTESGDMKDKIKKMITHPCIIAVFVGLIMMLVGIQLPTVVVNTVGTLSKCTTGISMLIIGMILANIKFTKCFSFDALYFSFIRLVLYPVLVLFVAKLFHFDSMVVSIATIMTAMPAGSTTAILAKQYGYDSEFAAKIVLVSTIFSIITIPVVCLML